MSKHSHAKWSRTRIDSLLRYGRKFDGPWCDNENDDGDMPTDFDTDLVTAAPDLLTACEALPDFDPENADASDFKDNADKFANAMMLARAAIAKAKGGAA